MCARANTHTHTHTQTQTHTWTHTYTLIKPIYWNGCHNLLPHFHPVPHTMHTCNINLIRAVADTSSPWPHTSSKQRPNKQAVSPSSASVPECAGGTLAGRV